MAKSSSSSSSHSIDLRSGYCPETKTFRDLRPPVPFPSETVPLSAASLALSLQSASPWRDATALIDSATGHRVSYSEFQRFTRNLASALRTTVGLCKNDVAFVISPNLISVPVLYFALLSLGIIISPANPLSTSEEISRLISISTPVIAFATSATADKLPKLKYPTILIDSPEFESMMERKSLDFEFRDVEISQNDVAAILYSSGTTGKVKGVLLTHRNFIAVTVPYYHSQQQERLFPPVMLYTIPYFHVFGFFFSLKSVAMSETAVVMGRFELRRMLRAVQEYKVTHVAMAPPVVVAMLNAIESEDYDLRSLEWVGCGGAPLGKDSIKSFTEKFPTVILAQGYGLTETTGVACRAMGPEESRRWGSVGRLVESYEAKIVDPETGIALPPGKQGELWIRGPSVMKGYLDDSKATSETLFSDGWLRTGDVCYFDNEGFLFVVDRLKELIKYKGYQVAPAELEQLLQSHPEIVDAAVIPYPDEEAGQVPLACVVRRPQSSLDEAQVLDFIAKRVAPYKKVRRVVFISSIPKSPAGKILRKELRKNWLPESKL
ncbi:4-coumarate--CoA ligase-like 9 [Abeliophyllum distichum]|uniref:4-coumarate--CoA ligase-like 9 n=1 Tax=Abeliophyllum distichum TaxID=126358 RepID=A0ABD1SY21_9LAMI